MYVLINFTNINFFVFYIIKSSANDWPGPQSRPKVLFVYLVRAWMIDFNVSSLTLIH